MTFWSTRRVLLTGAGGFLGRHLRAGIEARGPAELFAPRAAELDLREERAVEAFLAEKRPDLIIHAAAVVGGIGANRAHPGRFFYENALMGIQLIEHARRAGTAKLVCLGTVCAYPKFVQTPFRESDLWSGYPEETNAPYGLAKKMLLVQLQAYRQEYGFNGVYLLPANLYGPEDHFDPATSHVIPAMIRKFVEAVDSGAGSVSLWGDGTPTRDFLYVGDAVDAILRACEQYDEGEPVNIGTGEATSIAALAEIIAELTGFRGQIVWDETQPGGQPRRQLDVSRAREAFGFEPRMPLREGLRRTVSWYRERQA